MKNFEKINWGFSSKLAEAIRKEIAGREDLWLINTSRRKLPEQQHTHSINIRGLDRSKYIQGVPGVEVFESAPDPAAQKIPITASSLNLIAGFLQGRPNRAMLVRLEPNQKVYQHIDGGMNPRTYYHRCDRYHLIIDSDRGSPLNAGDEGVVMHTGELWWFDNLVNHWAENISDKPRIHLIFDLEPISGICRRDHRV